MMKNYAETLHEEMKSYVVEYKLQLLTSKLPKDPVLKTRSWQKIGWRNGMLRGICAVLHKIMPLSRRKLQLR
jgi:hypothetical protein